MADPLVGNPAEVSRRARRTVLWVYAGLVFVFLTLPVLVVIPLSFNGEPYFSFPISEFSLRWYNAFFSSAEWRSALWNSLVVASCTSILATVLGTVAAIGLCHPKMPYRQALIAFLISPMVIPSIISAVSLYFFLARLDLINTKVGVIFAHTLIATPFVVISVTATLSGFDYSLVRAAQSLGAPPVTTFYRVMLPLILPGVLFGSILAFVASFDEAIIILFIAGPEEITLPRMMWKGLREQLNPTLLAVAALLTLLSVMSLLAVEFLRRRGERMRSLQN